MKVIKQNTKQLSFQEISFSKLVGQAIDFYTKAYRVLFGDELNHRYSRKQKVLTPEELSEHLKRDLGL